MVKFLERNSGFNEWSANKTAARPKSKFGGFFWWILLFLILWWLFGLWLSPKNKGAQNKAAEEIIIEDISQVPAVEVKSDKISAKVQGLRLSDIKINELSKNAKDSDVKEPVSLLSDKDNFMEIGLLATGVAAPTPNTTWSQKGDSFSWHNPSGVDFKRTVSADGYLITVSDEITNKTKNDISFTPYVKILRTNNKISSMGVYTGLVAFINSDLEHEDWRSLDRKPRAYSTTNGFVGFADQYWETFASIKKPDQTIRVKKVGNKYQADASAAAVIIAPGGTETITTSIFAGPRNRAALLSVEGKIPGATKTIDYGWFWFLVRPMLWILDIINSFIGNYGVAIIFFTLILRLLMWPLTRKSYNSTMAMQKMQPEMAKIQKLYGNDKSRMQMEMMHLYQTHKTSPMSGCLPMIIQLPIFFALYKALLISVPMRSAHFLWISDLAAKDPYYILPILMGLTMWWQQRLQTPPDTKPAQEGTIGQTQKVMKWMPLIFTVMFAWMPAGLILFWTASNLFGIAQMYILKGQAKK